MAPTYSMKRIFLSLTVFVMAICSVLHAQQASPQPRLFIKKSADFEITGDGNNPAWENCTWTLLNKLDPGGTNYESKFKMLYSSTGIYVLFSGADNKITTTYDKDFDNLFLGDVFEVFFHTDPAIPLYFEYEINQLNKELVLIIPNLNGKINGWLPWHYEKDRKTKKMVNVKGGKASLNGTITSWTAEVFFPYNLLSPLGNIPPKSGTVWNANFYRLDYDNGSAIKWAWGPINKSFHEFTKFWPVQFE